MSSQLHIKKRKSPLSSKKKPITHTHKFKQEWSTENRSYVITWNYVGIFQYVVYTINTSLNNSNNHQEIQRKIQTIIKRFRETGTVDGAP